MSLGEIGKMYDVPKSTVNDIIKAFENHGFTKPQPRSGRPKILNNRDECHLIQMVNKDHKDPIAQITAKMNDATLKDVSVKTIQRTLHSHGYYGRVGLRKPFISEKNHCKRLEWCVERLDWDTQWNWIIWSDESRFELTGSNRRQWVWYRPDQKMDVDCLVPTFKSGQKSVMVWGCFT
jgi:hypothetical protein